MTFTLMGFSQEKSINVKNVKRLEINYPNYYYYDNRFIISQPIVNFGIKYFQTSNNNWGFQTSLSLDHMRNFKGANEFGDFVERNVLFPSFGGHYRFFNKSKLEIFVNIGIGGRLGWLDYFASSNEFETVLGLYELLDVGVSLGFSMLYQTKKRFFLSAEVKHNFYVYRYDIGWEPFIKPSPQNVTVLSFGAGWKLNNK